MDLNPVTRHPMRVLRDITSEGACPPTDTTRPLQKDSFSTPGAMHATTSSVGSRIPPNVVGGKSQSIDFSHWIASAGLVRGKRQTTRRLRALARGVSLCRDVR